MKKCFKILGALLVIAAMPLLYSCEDEDEFTPGDPDLDGCYGVYFPEQALSGIEVDPADPHELTIYAARTNTNGAITVPLEFTDEYGVFSITDLVFNDGQSESEILLSFESAEDGGSYSCSIAVSDPQYVSVYKEGAHGVDVSLSIVKWNVLGDCEYTDDFITGPFGVDPETWEVEIHENDSYPGYFRLVYPYDGKYVWNDPGDWDTSQIYYLYIHAEDPEGVYIEYQNIGVDWGYGPIYVWSYADYYYQNGYTWDTIKANGYCGTYKNGIIKFPVNALMTWMPDYSTDGWWYGNSNGAFKVVLPGATEPDYSAEVTAEADGFDVSATVTLGEDVESARVALVAGKDVDEAVTAITKGNVEYTEITESGDVSFTSTVGGSCMVVAVTYGDGEAQDSGYATVKIVDPDETWSLYGYGDYEYSIYWYATDPGLEIYQSDSDSERFKIADWGGGVDFVFTWDQDTNEVEVEDQSAGTNYSYYGAVYVDELSDYYGMGSSTYSAGTFYFALAYYVRAGYLGFGVETFTLTGGDKFSMSDLVGTYYVDGVSYFGSSYDVEGYPWVIEASDDPDWDIMLTYFNGWKCTSPLYGTFDTSTGLFTIYSGTDGQYFYNYQNVFDIYFVSYNALYYSRYGYDSGEFQLLPNGTFIGPLEDDLVGEYLYDHGTLNDEGWNQLFELVYGKKASTSSYSAYSASADETKNEVKVITNKVDYTPLMRTKIKYEKTAVQKDAKTDEASSKFSKKVLNGKVHGTPSL